MHFDFAVLCDDATPRQDGKLDIVGAGFDVIAAPAVPARHPRLVIAIRALMRPPEARTGHRIEVALVRDDDLEIYRADTVIDVVPEPILANVPEDGEMAVGVVLAFEDVVFPTHGLYRFTFTLDGDEARPPVLLHVRDPGE